MKTCNILCFGFSWNLSLS